MTPSTGASVWNRTTIPGFVDQCIIHYTTEALFGRGYWDRTSDDRVKVCSVTATLTPNCMVDRRGVEPRTPTCKAGVFPSIPAAHIEEYSGVVVR